MPFPLTDEQLALKARAGALADERVAPHAAATDRSERYPWANVEALRAAGMVGMAIPRELGGPGLGILDACIVVEEMARVCGVTGRIAVETNMGALSAILHYGSGQQRTLAADLVLSGDKPAICISEPEAGSAASEMRTRADRRGSHYVINGLKHWITGGGVSRLHLIFARVFDEQGVEQGIGGFVVVRDETPGLVIGDREPTMGLRGIPETVIRFENMRVPASSLLDPPGGLGRGFAALMDAYNTQRLGAASVALGLARGAFERALDFVTEREQFGRPICEFQGLQWMLADMSMQIEAARALIHQAAARSNPFPDALEAAQAKVFAAEMAVKVTNDALQLHGAYGYSRNAPLERMLRDARMFTIGGGTAQVLRNLIASRLLDRKLPQSREGYVQHRQAPAAA
ncbi:MAG: 3-sulfinopropanoyl-CoA desulfinase [Gammaproteobacteria bacterium]